MALDPQRELIELQLHGVETLWRSYQRTMDFYKAAITGKGQFNIPPHRLPGLKHAADRALDRWIHAVEVLVSYKQMLRMIVIDGPEQPPRGHKTLRIEHKKTGDGVIPVKVVKKKKPDDGKEAA
jgi:hypothetical protein